MSEDNPDSHSDGARKEQFCSERAEKCTCDKGNRYKSPCKSQASDWSEDDAGAKVKWKYPKLVGTRVQNWGHQAHHTLCVASVTGEVTVKVEIEEIVKKTVWCVNEKPNMIALPVWPMTINWYFSFQGAGGAVLASPVAKAASAVEASPPPFEGLAQHDYDHDKYNTKVNKALNELVEKVKTKKEKHQEAVDTLLGGLESARGRFLGQLQGRTTHASWLSGMNGGKSWYKEFSMVRASGTPRAFPAPNNDAFAYTFEKLVEAYGHA